MIARNGLGRVRLMAFLPAAILVLAACGSGGGSSASGTTPSAASTPSATASAAADCASLAGLDGKVEDHGTQPLTGQAVTLNAGDFFFEATCLTSSAGGTVTVTVTNIGSALHNFSVESQDIDEDVAAGESITVDVELPDSGTLGFKCKYHSSSGMVGAFVIG
jgi:plastocyanin